MNWYLLCLWLAVGVNIFATVLSGISKRRYDKAKEKYEECIATYDSVVKSQQDLINALMHERLEWLDNELSIIDLDETDDTNQNEENGGNQNEEK